MTSSQEGSTPQPQPVAQDENNGGGPIATCLVILWLAIPAVQYLGAYQRTEFQVRGLRPEGALATLDITPWYIVLLVVTILFAAFRFLTRRRVVPV